MDKILQGLHIHPPDICKDIEDLIQSTMKNLHRDGAVVSISGGLDSAVAATLTVRSLGVDKVHLLNMRTVNRFTSSTPYGLLNSLASH